MSIEDFINAVSEKDYAKAEPMFQDMMGQRMNDALDAEKIAVANKIYNGIEDDEEQLELDLDDTESNDEEWEEGSEEELNTEEPEINTEEEIEGHPV